MKIGYFADGPWAHESIAKIAEDSRFDITYIVPRFDNQDPILREWANKLEVDFLPFKDINSTESLEVLRGYEAELYVSMSFNQILKSKILDMPKLGFINCHAGALPFYRGRNILNWVLINDESHFGVTVHYIDEGIDTGDIITHVKPKIEIKPKITRMMARAKPLMRLSPISLKSRFSIEPLTTLLARPCTMMAEDCTPTFPAMAAISGV